MKVVINLDGETQLTVERRYVWSTTNDPGKRKLNLIKDRFELFSPSQGDWQEMVFEHAKALYQDAEIVDEEFISEPEGRIY